MISDKFSCCGSKPYSLNEDMCCKSEVYKWSEKSLCCENRTYDRDLQYCLNDREILNINQSKCNGVIYDTRRSVCCEGTTLHPHNVSQRCCGFEIFDRRTNDCVYDHIVTKHNSWCDPGTSFYSFINNSGCVHIQKYFGDKPNSISKNHLAILIVYILNDTVNSIVLFKL